MPDIAQGNIQRVIAVDMVAGTPAGYFDDDDNFVSEVGFFIRSAAGDIKYCPIGNGDAEAITKTVTASAIFVDPEVCRKIFKTGTTATGIHIGYGV